MICSECKEQKPLTSFSSRTSGGRKYPHVYCNPCRYQKKKGYPSTRDKAKYYRAYRDRLRSDPQRVVQCILQDTRRSDRKKGLENDLTKEFVETTIANGCVYCGETNLRMTLDRCDNSIGHVMTNVVSACYRCNLTRGSMPIEAWNFLIEGMRAARLAGAFGSWRSKSFSKTGASDRTRTCTSLNTDF